MREALFLQRGNEGVRRHNLAIHHQARQIGIRTGRRHGQQHYCRRRVQLRERVARCEERRVIKHWSLNRDDNLVVRVDQGADPRPVGVDRHLVADQRNNRHLLQRIIGLLSVRRRGQHETEEKGECTMDHLMTVP